MAVYKTTTVKPNSPELPYEVIHKETQDYESEITSSDPMIVISIMEKNITESFTTGETRTRRIIISYLPGDQEELQKPGLEAVFEVVKLIEKEGIDREVAKSQRMEKETEIYIETETDYYLLPVKELASLSKDVLLLLLLDININKEGDLASRIKTLIQSGNGNKQISMFMNRGQRAYTRTPIISAYS